MGVIMENCYFVLDADDLLPTAVPVCRYDELGDAIEHAAHRHSYVVHRNQNGTQYVMWVSPKLNRELLTETLIQVWEPRFAEHLKRRSDDLLRELQAHRMSEAA